MLRIVDDILRLIEHVGPLAREIARHDTDLARQLRRALSSVALNTAEGSNQRGARRASHYAIALGSAEESLTALHVARAWGYVDGVPDDVAAGFRRVIGTLHKVAHAA